MTDYQCFFATPNYEYWGNVEKKRLYTKFIGSWKDVDIISTFLEDTDKLAESMPLGIKTCITDLSVIGTAHHEKYQEAHKELHDRYLKYVKNLVMIVATHHNYSDIFYGNSSRTQTALRVGAYFYNFNAADAYLDKWQQGMEKVIEMQLRFKKELCY